MIEPKYWGLLLACIIAVVITFSSVDNEAFYGPETQHEDFIEETETEPEKRQIRREAVDLTAVEPETFTELVELPLETIPETTPEPETEPETVQETTTAPEPTEAYFPIYTVDGETLDHDLQRFMYEELKSQGIEWWMEYAVLTAYQESGFDVYDITDGIDYGLLQYRITYWPERSARYGYPDADIFNPYVQIYIYVRQTAERLRSGLSISDTISRHKQSDWGPYDQEYVNQVMGHELEQIR